jgi:hypothetical protein
MMICADVTSYAVSPAQDGSLVEERQRDDRFLW